MHFSKSCTVRCGTQKVTLWPPSQFQSLLSAPTGRFQGPFQTAALVSLEINIFTVSKKPGEHFLSFTFIGSRMEWFLIIVQMSFSLISYTVTFLQLTRVVLIHLKTPPVSLEVSYHHLIHMNYSLWCFGEG